MIKTGCILWTESPVAYYEKCSGDKYGYSRPKLQITAKADRTKPSSKDNPHHHKGVYMEYINE